MIPHFEVPVFKRIPRTPATERAAIVAHALHEVGFRGPLQLFADTRDDWRRGYTRLLAQNEQQHRALVAMSGMLRDQEREIVALKAENAALKAAQKSEPEAPEAAQETQNDKTLVEAQTA